MKTLCGLHSQAVWKMVEHCWNSWPCCLKTQRLLQKNAVKWHAQELLELVVRNSWWLSCEAPSLLLVHLRLPLLLQLQQQQQLPPHLPGSHLFAARCAPGCPRCCVGYQRLHTQRRLPHFFFCRCNTSPCLWQVPASRIRAGAALCCRDGRTAAVRAPRRPLERPKSTGGHLPERPPEHPQDTVALQPQEHPRDGRGLM